MAAPPKFCVMIGIIRRPWHRLVVLLPLLAGAVAWSAVRPSHDRIWVPEHARLPYAEIDGGRVRIHDVRDFRYTREGAPVRATPAQARALFTDILTRANALHAAPEFYGTILNNCTTAILDHVNRIASRPIRWGPRILLPGYSDALALELGLIDTTLSLDEARLAFHINARARTHAGAPDFSRRIRDNEPSDLAQSRRVAE